MTEIFVAYLWHSSVLLVFTLFLVQLPGLRRAGARDVLLKVAFLASVASPFLPTGLLALRLEPIVINTPKNLTNAATLSGNATISTGLAETILVHGKPEGNQTNRLDWHSIPLILIAIGIVINLVQFGRAWWIVWNLFCRAKPITRELCSNLEIETRVRVLSVSGILSPAAFGQHIIFIPEQLLPKLSKRQLQTVLAHEMAHLHRYDPIWNAGLSFLTRLCFFQPLNFLLLRTWQQASEELCDAEAARATKDPLLLARTLLDIARQQNTIPNPLTTNIANSTHLTKRITSLLNAKEVHMKRSYMVLFSLLPIVATLLLPIITFAQNTQTIKTVVLDAGHGGIDSGAVGYANEAEVNLSVAKKVRALLEARGINVVMTREDDSYVELEQRVKFANLGTDVFISLHTSAAANSNVSGIETWFHRPLEITFSMDDVEFNEDSGELEYGEFEYPDDSMESNDVDLAELTLTYALQAELINTTGAKDRGTREDIFYVLRHVNVPSVMVNLGFLTNPEEGAKLSTDAYQQTLADTIANTLIDYLE